MAQAAASTCEICTGGPGEYYCQQCDQLFCGSCKLSHLRTKSCKNHTFSSGTKINKEERFLCTEHEEMFFFYCHDCGTPVCRICSVKKHSRHLMTDLAESTEKLRSELVKNIESKVATSNVTLTEIEKDTKAYREKVKAIIKTITEEGKNWKKLIDKKINSLVKLVQNGEQKALQSMSVLTTFNRELLEKYQQLQNNVKEMEITADVSLVQKLKQIKTDVDNIEIKHIPVTPSVSYINRKPSVTDIDTLFGELQFREGQSFMEKTDNQESSRPPSVHKRYKYICTCCKREQILTKEPETHRMNIECNNSKCFLYKMSSWHTFKDEAQNPNT
ncbi:E3 ubiquitin-protein ligase TRIM36-like isoform X2 [Mytilus californianus]|uniref:E3 ubiquitin-protein ligase TRIM36-like isoform X2 n=1 Tax=Mytilus californianus TaxID=6549 RepID=UPI002245B900|nr:E3 ubiquitin-protein ligase TRIM36-like isoform X2 [Mytilus californianus]